MTLAPGASRTDTLASVTMDYNKLIRNDDIATLNTQPINNAMKGLEHIVNIY